MVDLMYRLTNLLFFDIPLLCSVNINSSIIFCLSSGDIYLSFGISFLTFFQCNSIELSFECTFEAFVILSAILLPIKSLVASAVF